MTFTESKFFQRLITLIIIGSSTSVFAVPVTGRVTVQGSGAPLDGFEVRTGGNSATVDSSGEFSLEASSTDVQVDVFSSTGVYFGTYPLSASNRDVEVIPTGYVYVANSGEPAVGLKIRLRASGGSLVTPSAIEQGQQNQKTDKHGLYRFDPKQSGQFVIEVVATDVAYTFPSTNNPPSNDQLPANGEASDQQQPNPAQPSSYWLSFDTTADRLSAPVNNHIPVDRSRDVVVVSKQANKGEVRVGEVITYTVKVKNGSQRDYVRLGGSGGLIVRDVLPPELRLVDNSAVATVAGLPIPMIAPTTTQSLEFMARNPGSNKGVGFELRRGATLVVRYQAVVGVNSRADQTITNRVEVRTRSGERVSQTATADVRVVADAMFDRGWIRGRVYCDDDGDGWAGRHDPGIYGARVYIDTGRYAVTDRHGKFHLTDIPAGLHLVKVDTDTVPPGSQPATPTFRTLHMSRGFSHQVSFGFNCNLVPARPSTVVRAETEASTVVPPTVIVSGSVNDMSISVDGKPVSKSTITNLQMMSMGVSKGVPDLGWGPSRLRTPLRMRLQTPKDTKMWRLWIEVQEANDKWRPVREFHGLKQAPSVLDWNGLDTSGRSIVVSRGSLHRARLVVIDSVGSRFTTSPVYFSSGWGGKPAIATIKVKGRIFTKRGNPKGLLIRHVRRMAKILKQSLTTQVVVTVPVAKNPTSKEIDDAYKRASSTSRLIVKASKASSDRVGIRVASGTSDVVLDAYDSALKQPGVEPIALKTNKSSVRVGSLDVRPDKKGRFVAALPKPDDGLVVVELTNDKGARREVSVRIGAAKTDNYILTAALEKGGLSVAGTDIDLASLSTRIRLPFTAMQVTDGGQPVKPIIFELDIPKLAIKSWRIGVTGPLGVEVFTQSGEGAPPKKVTWNDVLNLEEGDYIYGLHLVTATGAKTHSPSRVFIVSGEPAPPTKKVALGDGPPQQQWALSVNDKIVSLDKEGTANIAFPYTDDGKIQIKVTGRHGQRLITEVNKTRPKAEPELQKVAPFGIATLANALDRHKKKLGPPTPLAVAELKAELPPDGAILGQPLLPIQGSLPPISGISVSVNGRPVLVEDYRFEVLLPLPSGKKSPVVIEARDKQGNVARIERNYTVKGNALFLLVLADGAVTGERAGLDGVQSNTSFKAGSVMLHGRGALYLKARLKGNDLIKQWRFTAFVDSARQKQYSQFIDQIIDPDRHYPIYGDAGEQHTDARTRGKFFVAVEADESKMIVGAFKPSDWGVELLRYGRVLDGVQIVLKKAFVKGYETVVEGFANLQEQSLRRGFAIMRGTGGSYYFLPDREIIESSETITVAIYDRDNGGLLRSVPQVRHADYEIDYRSGRVVFKKPIPSQVTASFLMGAADSLTGSLGLGGHEVRIQVDYQTRSPQHLADSTYGIHGKQTFADTVTVGAGYLRESNNPQVEDYELVGATLAVKPTKTTRIDAEVAHSTSTNGSGRISHDGGLSYKTLSPTLGQSRNGMGISAKAETDIGEFLGHERPFLEISANFRQQDSGFVASHKTLEQGTTRGGAQMRWHIDRRRRLVVRHDTLKSMTDDLAAEDGSRDRRRSLSTAQYTQRIRRWTVVSELMHSNEFDELGDIEGTEASFNRGGLSGMLRYRLSNRVGLYVEQQFLVGGDERVFRSALDGIVSGLGVDINLGQDVSINIGERFRWSGEDTTVFGMRAKLSEKATMYTEQRLVHPRDSHRWVPATVMGSEERWGPRDQGRSYGEYQTGTSVNGLYNRSVLGLGRRFKVRPGLYADIAVERSHSVLVNDIGIERDMNTISLGSDYVGYKWLKLATRFEARFESSDHDRWQMVSFNRVTAELNRAVSLFGRADIAVTQNKDLDKREAETVNLTVGLAFRPMDEKVSVLLKAARLVDMRPIDPLDASSLPSRTQAVVYSLEPIFELPLRLQITPKLAYRHLVESVEGAKNEVESHTLLTGLRLALHVWKMLDIAGEYRMMFVDLSSQIEHGTLAEMAVNISKYARIGVGYNFAYFDDNLFDPLSRNNHGFFVRLSGMY